MERHRDFALRMYDAINRRDLATFLEGATEDVEFRSLVAEADARVYRGHDGVREWWTDVAQLMGGMGFDMEDYAEEGDGCVIKVRVRAHHGTTGIEQGMWMAAVITESGQARWWQTFRTEEEAWVTLRERLGS